MRANVEALIPKFQDDERNVQHAAADGLRYASPLRRSHVSQNQGEPIKMRIALVVTILLLLCGVGVCAESQRKDKDEIKPAEAQQMTGNKQRGTEEAPVVVKIIPPKIDKIDSDADAKEKEEKKTLDSWLVFFTGCLAAIGLMQLIVFGLQARRLRQTVEATKEAADAAKKSADAAELTAQAALGVELPRFVVTSMKLIWNGTEPHISITLTNHGRTEAVVTGECLIYRKEPALAPIPRYPISSQKRIDFGKTIKTGESHIIRESIPSNDICANSDSPIIWGYGYIKYRDFLGKIHTSGFVGGAPMQSCSRDVNVGRVGVDFEQQGPSAYTYEKYEGNEA